MEIKTSKLFPIGRIQLDAQMRDEIHTIDSIRISEIDMTILREKLEARDTQILSDGTDHYILRENIIIQITHPKLNQLWMY